MSKVITIEIDVEVSDLALVLSPDVDDEIRYQLLKMLKEHRGEIRIKEEVS